MEDIEGINNDNNHNSNNINNNNNNVNNKNVLRKNFWVFLNGSRRIGKTDERN